MTKLEIQLEVPPKGSRRRLQSLYSQLRDAILSGRLASGTRLPSTRALAAQWGVARATAVTLYERLLSEGYLMTSLGAGTFVAAPRVERLGRRRPKKLPPLSPQRRRVLGQPPPRRLESARYDLRPGVPDLSLFPFDTWRRLTGRTLRHLGRSRADYLEPEGLESLRRAMAQHLASTRGLSCSGDELLITNGAQQAFDLIARALVRPGATRVAVEDPGYPGARGAFGLAGARLVPVAVDDEGLCVDRIPRDVDLILVTPSHQFPTGVVLSYARRRALLLLAEEIGAVVVEDDYDSEFRLASRPLDALATLTPSERVVYVGTFSKSLFPMLRVGFVRAPAWLRKALAALRQASDWHTESLVQETLASFLVEGHHRRYLNKMRRVYRERQAVLEAAIERYCGSWLRPLQQFAGLHLAAELSARLDAETVAGAARKKGIALDWFSRYALRRSSKEGLVLGYGGCAADRLEEAVRRVAAAMRSCQR